MSPLWTSATCWCSTFCDGRWVLSEESDDWSFKLGKLSWKAAFTMPPCSDWGVTLDFFFLLLLRMVSGGDTLYLWVTNPPGSPFSLEASPLVSDSSGIVSYSLSACIALCTSISSAVCCSAVSCRGLNRTWCAGFRDLSAACIKTSGGLDIFWACFIAIKLNAATLSFLFFFDILLSKSFCLLTFRLDKTWSIGSRMRTRRASAPVM